jgi:hypothetical protein
MGFMDLFSSGIVQTVGKVADDLITSDEERLEKENEKAKAEMKYKADMRKSDVEETKAYLKDTQSAREMNSNLTQSKDWLVRNTGSLMAWIVVACTFGLDGYVIRYGLSAVEIANKDVLMFVLGAMNVYTATVMNFYFGSSKNEADKQRLKG